MAKPPPLYNVTTAADWCITTDLKNQGEQCMRVPRSPQTMLLGIALT